MLRLSNEFEEIENVGKPISDEFSEKAKSKIPRLISKLLVAFDTWASITPEERLALETQESVEQLKGKLLRDASTLRKQALQFIENLAAQRRTPDVNENWLNQFFAFLGPKCVDSAIMEIVDMRCNPQLYPMEKNQTYKIALQRLGLVFENIVMLVGQNHSDTKISSVFQNRERLTLEYMLSVLFDYDANLKAVLRTYSGFDRSKSVKDFEEKITQLLDDTGVRFPSYIRYYTLSALIRNYYSHEGCQDTIINKDESLFQQAVNDGLLSSISIVRFFDRYNKIKLPTLTNSTQVN